MKVSSIVTAFSLLLFSQIILKSEEEQAKVPMLKIEGEAAKVYEKAFWKEYEKQKVSLQIYRSLYGKEPPEGEEVKVAMSMEGPFVFKNKLDQSVETYLALGFIGYYQVNFDKERNVKSSFFVGSPENKKVVCDTFQELHKLWRAYLDKLSKDKQE